MTAGNEQRQLPSWIESFCEYTKDRQSPLIFRKWAAIATIVGAMERKVWIRAFGQVLYPNMFVVLIGGPGVGKTQAIRETEFFWRQLTGLHVAPDSVTRASLIDDLFGAARRIVRPGENPAYIEFHSLQCPAEEFGVFVPQYEGEFINTLNKLYDCGKQFEESRRGNKGERKKFRNPQLNIIGGTTPSWLKDVLPEGAWQQGFTSRIILIYSGEAVTVDPWADYTQDQNLEEALSADLRNIFHLFGQMVFDENVAKVFSNWYLGGKQPAPDHPRLAHYLPRRHIHLLKLAMAYSVSRSSELRITMEDYQNAMDTLTEAEGYMPDVFKAMNAGGDAVIDEAYRFIWGLFSKEKKPISEHRLIYYLIQRIPSHQAPHVVEMMIQSQLLAVAEIGEKGRRGLQPLQRY